MNNFCTLFDSHFLTRGLAMYRSLETTGADYHLYVYAFDALSRDILQRMALPRMTVVALAEFENEQLLAVKPTRSRGEYCWTCTSHVIAHALEIFCLSEITYIDADLYFYSDPAPLLDEFHASGGSVLLTEHRYTPCYNRFVRISGTFCVQFITFRNDAHGLSALHWWQERCLEWCYAKAEDGKFGDQKYLDDWPARFSGIYVLQHLGGGVAPWNIQQYRLEIQDEKLFIDEIPIMFYHFHNYQWYENGCHWLGNYRLGPLVVDLLYRPYVRALEAAKHQVRAVMPGFDAGGSRRERMLISPLLYVVNKLKGTYNVHKTL
jgi:hypothetical protein